MTERRRLDSWKEIAEFLGRSTRTVQRWHRESGLPVHQVPGRTRGSVFAFSDELAAWLNNPKGAGSLTGEGPEVTKTGALQPFDVGEDDAAGQTSRPSRAESSLPPPDGSRQSGTDEEPGLNSTPYPSEANYLFVNNLRRSGTEHGRWRGKSGRTILAAVILLVAAIILLSVHPWAGHPPAAEEPGYRVRTAGHELSLLTPGGQTAWTRRFGEPLCDEALHASRKVEYFFEPGYYFQHLQDLDGDGQIEILAMTGWRGNNRISPAVLHCLDREGRTRWTFQPGRNMSFGTSRFDENWIIRYFQVQDFNGDGRPEILVNTNHHSDYPARLCLLDAAGKLQAEFTNSGWIAQAHWLDLDGDGRRELLCGAANNGYQTSALFILDPATMAGASPQPDTPDYRCPGLPVGRFRLYLLFPRDCLTRLKRQFGIVKFLIRGQTPLRLRATTLSHHQNQAGELHFFLDAGFSVEDIQAGNEYIANHDRCFAEGLLDHSFTPSELRRLEPARYWDGRRYITSPPRNLPR